MSCIKVSPLLQDKVADSTTARNILWTSSSVPPGLILRLGLASPSWALTVRICKISSCCLDQILLLEMILLCARSVGAISELFIRSVPRQWQSTTLRIMSRALCNTVSGLKTAGLDSKTSPLAIAFHSVLWQKARRIEGRDPMGRTSSKQPHVEFWNNGVLRPKTVWGCSRK